MCFFGLTSEVKRAKKSWSLRGSDPIQESGGKAFERRPRPKQTSKQNEKEANAGQEEYMFIRKGGAMFNSLESIGWYGVRYSKGYPRNPTRQSLRRY